MLKIKKKGGGQHRVLSTSTCDISYWIFYDDNHENDRLNIVYASQDLFYTSYEINCECWEWNYYLTRLETWVWWPTLNESHWSTDTIMHVTQLTVCESQFIV